MQNAVVFQVNKEGLKADEKLVMLLRVYTVDVDTRELVVIGSCLFEVFDDAKVSGYTTEKLTQYRV